MPDTEDGSGKGCDRIQVGQGQGDSEPGVLHADFDGDGPAAGLIQFQDPGAPIPQEQAEGVVQNDCQNHRKCCFSQAVGIECHHSGYDDDNGGDRDQRKGLCSPLDDHGKESADQQSQKDRENHHLQDGQDHRSKVHRQPGTGQGPEEERGDQGGQQGGDTGQGDRQGNIPLGQIDDHIGGGPAGASSHQDHSGGQFRGQSQGSGDDPGSGGHDDELEANSCQHRSGSLEDQPEILSFQGESHSEHDDSQERSDGGADPSKDFRKHPGGAGENQNPEGEGLLCEATGLVPTLQEAPSLSSTE